MAARLLAACAGVSITIALVAALLLVCKALQVCTALAGVAGDKSWRGEEKPPRRNFFVGQRLGVAPS
jgi:hypothetical protein